jgi:hypothetical protein
MLSRYARSREKLDMDSEQELPRGIDDWLQCKSMWDALRRATRGGFRCGPQFGCELPTINLKNSRLCNPAAVSSQGLHVLRGSPLRLRVRVQASLIIR